MPHPLLSKLAEGTVPAGGAMGPILGAADVPRQGCLA